MKENQFLDGLNNIEDEIVEQFINMDCKLQESARKKTKIIWIRYSAMASCIALIVSAALLVPKIFNDDPQTVVSNSDISHGDFYISEPEQSEPEQSDPDSSEPESSEPNSSEPESSEPESSEPESSEPNSSEPESSEPNSSEPESSEPNSELPPIPNWDDAKYSSWQISQLFNNQYESVSTKAYTTVVVPDAKYLPIDELPNEEYLPLYYQIGIEPDLSCEPDESNEFGLNEEELLSFFDEQLPNASDFIGVSIPKEKFTKMQFSNRLVLYYDMGSHYIMLNQNEDFNSFCVRGKQTSIVGGETIQIDQRLSDEEIIETIQNVKNKLFEAFDVSFTDVKITRSFDEYSTNGANYIHIYFYDKNAHLLNSLQKIPVSDYICISFDNNKNFTGKNASDSILNNCEVTYYEMRYDLQTKYAVKSNAEIISIEEAEILLYNGYVFGGHSCSLCMASQENVSFEGYDFVDIEYVFQTESIYNNMNLGVPFYAFYKKIGTGKNGNSIYAKTYVAAIKVRGYAAYFESQKSNHKNT